MYKIENIISKIISNQSFFYELYQVNMKGIEKFH